MHARKKRDDRTQSATASFDHADERDTSPDDRPAHADTSHVARRRQGSSPAHEVTLDDLLEGEDAYFDRTSDPDGASIEIVDELPSLPIEASEPMIDASSYTPEASSVSRVSRAPFDVPLAPISRTPISAPISTAPVTHASIASEPIANPRRFNVNVTTVVALLALIVAAASFVRRGFPVDASAPAAAPPAVAVDVPPPAPAPPPVAPARAPELHFGTVIGLSDHRLWIDGRLESDWTATVACGSHVVQVGSAGTPKTVDVPCGEELKVSP
jgi:hypothetical protein